MNTGSHWEVYNQSELPQHQGLPRERPLQTDTKEGNVKIQRAFRLIICQLTSETILEPVTSA
jgi:hypothetical protein